jgi:hypothetical protein
MEIWEGGNPWLFYRKNRKEVAVDIGTPERVKQSIPCLGQRVTVNGIPL